MQKRFIRYFAIPMIVATFLTLAWAAAIEYLWSNMGLSSAVLLEGTQANRVSSRLARVDEAVVPVIWYSVSALLLPLLLWFLKCWSMKIGTGEARLLRGTWISLFLLSLVMCAAITYFQGFRVGNLGAFMNKNAMIKLSFSGATLLFAGYWLISLIATNRVYRPATLPF